MKLARARLAVAALALRGVLRFAVLPDLGLRRRLEAGDRELAR